MQIEMLKVKDLIPYERNPRNNKEAVEFVANSIKEFGFKNPIIIDKDNVIVAGHTRLLAAKKLKIKEVPCVRADDLTDEQVKAFRIADNSTARVAEWDYDLLNFEIEDLPEFDFADFGLELDFNNDDEPEEIIEDDFDAEPPAEPKAKLGDIYQLGRHRLMCGDSTNINDVERLMDGEKADMVFTDPPYNVAIGDKNKALQSFQKAGRITENIANDSGMTDEECSQVLWLPAFTNMLLVAKDCCSIYVTMPQGGTHMMMMMMHEAGWRVKHELVWVKNSPTFSMGRLDYDYQHEPICFGWNKTHKKIGKGKFTKSIWEIDKPRKCNLHPTMKPIELIVNALENSSEHNDNIVDLFGGSGSTIMACEQTNRNCYTMELDPKYVDVIINRWEQFTGEKAVLING